MTNPARRELIATVHRAAYQLRKDVVDLVHDGGSGHPGGAMSAADIIATLYWHVMRIDPRDPTWSDRDRFVKALNPHAQSGGRHQNSAPPFSKPLPSPRASGSLRRM